MFFKKKEPAKLGYDPKDWQRVANEFLDWMSASTGNDNPFLGLKDKFAAGGLAPTFNRWVNGSGKLPTFGAEEVYKVLGEDTVKQIAERSFPDNPGKAEGLLTDIIPKVVLVLSPFGETPSAPLARAGVRDLRRDI